MIIVIVIQIIVKVMQIIVSVISISINSNSNTNNVPEDMSGRGAPLDRDYEADRGDRGDEAGSFQDARRRFRMIAKSRGLFKQCGPPEKTYISGKSYGRRPAPTAASGLNTLLAK